MKHMMGALVAILLTFWLLVSGQGLLAACLYRPTTNSNDAPPALDVSKSCAASTCAGAAAPIHSRLVNYPGKGSIATCEQPGRTFSVPSTAVARLAPHSNDSVFSTPWQFACRAALEPRAPSFAS